MTLVLNDSLYGSAKINTEHSLRCYLALGYGEISGTGQSNQKKLTIVLSWTWTKRSCSGPGHGYAGERGSVLAAQNRDGRGEWSGPCPWRDNVVRPVSRQARCQRLCDVLLLASSAQTGPTFTRCGVRGYAGPRFCDVTRGLLQHHSRWGIQVYHRQAPASNECCCSRRQWFAEVRSRTHQSTARQTALAWRSRAGAVQAVCNGSPMSAAQGTTVNCVYTSDIARRQHLRSAGCPQLLVPRHRRSMFGRWAFSVAGPAARNSLPDYLGDPTRSVESFRRDLKTLLISFY